MQSELICLSCLQGFYNGYSRRSQRVYECAREAKLHSQRDFRRKWVSDWRSGKIAANTCSYRAVAYADFAAEVGNDFTLTFQRTSIRGMVSDTPERTSSGCVSRTGLGSGLLQR